MTYKEQHPNFPTKTHFATFTKKDYPYISYIYTNKCKEPIHFKPRLGKTIHFSIKNYLNLHFELEDKKFNFEYSDLTDTEYVNLCNILINNQNCYAKDKNDVGKISTPFRIRIKENCKLQTQRPSKVPIHYRDRLNKLLTELEKYNIIKQIGSSSDEKHTIGTTFLNP